MKRRNKSFSTYKLLVFAVLLFIGQRACSPPPIEAMDAQRQITVNQVYSDLRNIVDQPMMIRGKVLSSFFVGSLGGGFFLQDDSTEKTIICLTRLLPPPDGATVKVLGIVKPLICKGDINFLYVKTAGFESTRTYFDLP